MADDEAEIQKFIAERGVTKCPSYVPVPEVAAHSDTLRGILEMLEPSHG